MDAAPAPKVLDLPRRERSFRWRPGDLVVHMRDYPMLCEVISVRDDGLLRVRGLNWAPGYSALVSAKEVRPTTGILQD